MAIDSTPRRTFRRNLKSVVLTLLIYASVLLICGSLMWLDARKTQQGAVERAVEIAKAIPYPTDTVEIKNWSGLHYASWECYSGYSYYFYGSNLSHSEVIQSYREYFEQKGWAVYEESSNERDLSVWEEGEIAGFDINVTLCDSVVECADSTSSQEDQDIIKIALQQYTTTFWLKVFYKPESIRGNLCGCCGA